MAGMFVSNYCGWKTADLPRGPLDAFIICILLVYTSAIFFYRVYYLVVSPRIKRKSL